MECLYSILGVDPKSSQSEIKKAYRVLQMKYHPDRNPGNSESVHMAQKINDAYEILGDPEKRRDYDVPKHTTHHGDMTDEDAIHMMFQSGFGGMFPLFQGRTFPGASFQHVDRRPPPIDIPIKITMKNAFDGGSIPVEVSRWVIQGGNKVHECEVVYITIPEGIDTGEIIYLRGRGHAVSNSCVGDVRVLITVLQDKSFERSGLDLIYTNKISLRESLCGFRFELDHINGKKYVLNNQKGSIIPPGFKKIYSGLGFRRDLFKGNLIVVFVVEFPQTISEQQIEQLEKILF